MRVEAIAADLRVRGATQVETFVADCAQADATSLVKRIVEMLGGLDVALLAYGVLGDQAQFERDPDAMADLLHVNFTSAAAWCQAIAAVLERQRSGALLVIGSVAGDRGRASNYVYGASKAGLGVFVEGVAHRLARAGARRGSDQARLCRYADDCGSGPQKRTLGEAGGRRANNRRLGPSRSPRGLRAVVLEGDHVGRPKYSVNDFSQNEALSCDHRPSGDAQGRCFEGRGAPVVHPHPSVAVKTERQVGSQSSKLLNSAGPKTLSKAFSIKGLGKQKAAYSLTVPG